MWPNFPPSRWRESARFLTVALVAVAGVWPLHAQHPGNTTLQLPATPPVFGFTSVNALGEMTFTNPVCITSPPGETNRLFILEKRGRIIVITNLASPTRTLFLNLVSRVGATDTVSDERGLLGMAFHPGYNTNGQFFVFYTTSGALRDRLSRFRVSPDNPNQADAASEEILFSQTDEAENHNGGDLHFGPDGYLYVSLGDEGGGNDQFNNSQRIDRDFFAGMLRLDVDRRPGNLEPNNHAAIVKDTAGNARYAVPADNPFIGTTNFNRIQVNPANVRTEFWAVGLRNPWRIAFDPANGTLYCGDVGQGAREEVDIIVRGGNYGWAYREGLIAGPKSAPAGFTSVNPILDYPRNEGVSITGGIVYRGSRLAQLWGAYLFADYGSGRIWATRYDGAKASPRQLLFSDSGISAFGVDPSNGDVLYADVASGTNGSIDRIVYNATFTGTPLPQTLADTGAFADLTTLQPNPGILPYDINLPFWSDNALKTRWFSIPDSNATIGFDRAHSWSLPSGTVWIKHFDLELTNGVPASARRLETRFIVRNTNGVHGFTYRWSDPATNAILVAEEGLDESFVVYDNGVPRTQIWRYPSRAECLQCHTPAGGLALGFNTAQLHRSGPASAPGESQIAALSRMGYFSGPIDGLALLPALAHATNDAYSLDYRAHSYLAANCAQCHQPNGPALGMFDARISTPFSAAGILDGALHNGFVDANHRVARLGSPANSMALLRIGTLGPERMPPLSTAVVDAQAVQLLTDWLTTSQSFQSDYSAWMIRHFNSTNNPSGARLADPDGDGAANELEFLTATDPTRAEDRWNIAVESAGETIRIRFQHIANRGFEVQSTSNLFDPASWRPLDTAANRPFFPATSFAATITDTLPNSGHRFYRVRVFEH